MKFGQRMERHRIKTIEPVLDRNFLRKVTSLAGKGVL